MYYTIYKTTNNISGKYYIGKHQTNNLDDDYMGSGKHLNRSIAKYGLGNFIKEILHIFDNEQDMNAMEKELVTEEFCSRSDTYNICEGGHGGFGYINQNDLRNSSKGGKNTQNILNQKYGSSWKKEFQKNGLEAIKRKVEENPNFRKEINCKTKTGHGSFYDKHHTPETKRKMSETQKERLKDPHNNHRYGTRWITNGTENKMIKKIETIPKNWYKGRTV